ncbi:uncharacterized protein LOC123313552 isoform X2 [Coccinella septempunctata]|uniref:uncharacterized protein LOC123313552 isoform X2 n=1 Tax=Coccinella septempunctata TaxID=41139 RepID=UPI001D06A656|nr:uncharacterized protein LOC123313552 isoform X2 [Coccinella septempunctata]
MGPIREEENIPTQNEMYNLRSTKKKQLEGEEEAGALPDVSNELEDVQPQKASNMGAIPKRPTMFETPKTEKSRTNHPGF